MSKQISILGVSGSGKTCYIYALAQVMKHGARYKDTNISIISNDSGMQIDLDNGYLSMAVDKLWPLSTSSDNYVYDFLVKVHSPLGYMDLIPSLEMRDYRGGVLSDPQKYKNEHDEILSKFRESASIIFLIDAETAWQALDTLDMNPNHRREVSQIDILKARNSICYIENILRDYRKLNNEIPPIAIAVTKSDLFGDDEEKENAIDNIKDMLPVIFAKGSGVEASICTVSLGQNLGTGSNNELSGTLDISTNTNIHIPFLFGIYNYLDNIYDGSTPTEQKYIDNVLYSIRRMFENNIQIFIDGEPAIEIE